jgi:hypothetical protein
MAEDAVLPQRGLQQQAVPVAVLGDVADAVLAPLAGGGVGDVGAVEGDGARVGVAHAHDGLDQFGLAVALDPGDAEDFALVDGEADAVQDGPLDRSTSVAVSRTPSRCSIPVSVTVDSRVSGEGSSLPTISSASCAGR